MNTSQTLFASLFDLIQPQRKWLPFAERDPNFGGQQTRFAGCVQQLVDFGERAHRRWLSRQFATQPPDVNLVKPAGLNMGPGVLLNQFSQYFGLPTNCQVHGDNGIFQRRGGDGTEVFAYAIQVDATPLRIVANMLGPIHDATVADLN